MATAEELLAQMEENPELYADSTGPVNDVIIINAEERTIELPESERKFGTESDRKSERKHFKCPKIVGDNLDLSTFSLFINFKNANNEVDIYPIDDAEVDGDYITFSWLLSKKVTAYKTDASKNQLLSFIFCAKSGEGPENEWNTTLCSDGIVLEGLEPGESIVEDNPDIIQYILERLDSAGVITPEQISQAVEEYFANNPIEETDPTVPAWAKQPNKPSYTAQEVGALPAGTKIPSRTSDLQNDSGFLTEHQDLSGYALKSEVPKSASDVGADASGTAENKVSEHNASDTAHNDIRLLIQTLVNKVNTLLDSDDETLDQTSEIVAYIKSNKSLIDAITTSKVNVSDIIDNLTTNVANKPLSASQGVKLKALIDALQTELSRIEIPVNDVQINGTSVVENGVANIPIAGANIPGVIFINRPKRYIYGLEMQNNTLIICPAQENHIKTRNISTTYQSSPLSVGNLDIAVKYAITDGVGAAWTDTEKTGAWSRLTSIKTSMDEVAVAGSHYYLSELTELTITLPDDALVGQETTIVWYNGENPATLAISGNMLDFDYAPSANSRSEISALWDGTYWCLISNEQSVPVMEEVS